MSDARIIRIFDTTLRDGEQSPGASMNLDEKMKIAHALVGPGHGHNDVWKLKCKEIGAIPERVSFDVEMPPGRWQATCTACGMQHHKHRRPKHMVGWYCRSCGRERGKLIWKSAREKEICKDRRTAG